MTGAGHISINQSRYENLNLGKLDLLPHAPFVPMARVRSFQRVRLRLHLQDEIHYVLERNIILTQNGLVE